MIKIGACCRQTDGITQELAEDKSKVVPVQNPCLKTFQRFEENS